MAQGESLPHPWMGCQRITDNNIYQIIRILITECDKALSKAWWHEAGLIDMNARFNHDYVTHWQTSVRASHCIGSQDRKFHCQFHYSYAISLLRYLISAVGVL